MARQPRVTPVQAPSPTMPRLPPWMDPAYVLTVGEWRFRRLASAVAPAFGMVPGSARRIAIGFSAGVPAVANCVVQPHTESGGYGWLLPTDGTVVWFWLMRHGALVCAEWYMQSAGGGDVGVYTAELSA